jgi:ribonuclease HI
MDLRKYMLQISKLSYMFLIPALALCIQCRPTCIYMNSTRMYLSLRLKLYINNGPEHTVPQVYSHSKYLLRFLCRVSFLRLTKLSTIYLSFEYFSWVQSHDGRPRNQRIASLIAGGCDETELQNAKRQFSIEFLLFALLLKEVQSSLHIRV